MKSIESIEREVLPDLDADWSWLDQIEFADIRDERKARVADGLLSMVGVRAKAEIVVNGIHETITSPGLWGIEDDSDESYFAEVYRNELDTLCDMLKELGFAPITDIKPHVPELGENWPDE